MELTAEQRELALRFLAEDSIKQVINVTRYPSKRDLKIIDGLERGMNVRRIATEAELSVPRIYQIREKWERAKARAKK